MHNINIIFDYNFLSYVLMISIINIFCLNVNLKKLKFSTSVRLFLNDVIYYNYYLIDLDTDIFNSLLYQYLRH